jgi:hypothetical protein
VTNPVRPAITRDDYPSQIASNDSLEWTTWPFDEDDVEKDDEQDAQSFQGEIPYELLDEPEVFAEKFSLHVLRVGSKEVRWADEIAVDFGVGVYWSYHDECETKRAVIRRTSAHHVRAWLDARWETEGLADHQADAFDYYLEGFGFGLRVEGEHVLSLEDYGEADLEAVTMVLVAPGHFVLNAKSPRGHRIRTVTSLTEAHSIVKRLVDVHYCDPTIGADWISDWNHLEDGGA